MSSPTSVCDGYEVLTGRMLYGRDLSTLTCLTTQEKRTAVEQARAGNQQAREKIILHCLYDVQELAARYCRSFRSMEYMDLIEVGNLALVARFEQALWKSDPFPYLKAAAKFEILKYCLQYRSLIRCPLPLARGELPPAVAIESFDGPDQAPLRETLTDLPCGVPDQTRSFAALYQVLERAITPKERENLARYFGLFGYARHTLAEIGRQVYGNPRHGAASTLKLRAQHKLHKALSTVLEQGGLAALTA